jgi:hypothetical protein
MKKPAANSTFAIGGVSCSADNFVVAESSVLRINIFAEKPAHRKSAKRYAFSFPCQRVVVVKQIFRYDFSEIALTFNSFHQSQKIVSFR